MSSMSIHDIPLQARARSGAAPHIIVNPLLNFPQSTELLIRKAPFSRLVRELARGSLPDVRFTGMAMAALQARPRAEALTAQTSASVVSCRRIS